jgi:hypothetical protein
VQFLSPLSRLPPEPDMSSQHAAPLPQKKGVTLLTLVASIWQIVSGPLHRIEQLSAQTRPSQMQPSVHSQGLLSVQVASHSHDGWQKSLEQIPMMQNSTGMQPFPHHPQFSGSVSTSISQPSDSLLLQSSKNSTHSPITHS